MMNNIIQEIENVKYCVEKAKVGGEYTLALQQDGKKQYVLSKYKPKEYCISLLGENYGNKQTLWILFGFNLGYWLEELLKKVGEDVRVVIIEPNKKCLDAQLKIYEVCKELLNKENVVVFSGTGLEELRKILDAQITMEDFNNFFVKSSDTYLEIYKYYFVEVLKIIGETMNKRLINFNTVASCRLQWIGNIVRNRHKIFESYDLLEHKRRYTNIPAVIVSAGPSLKKNIHKLKDFKGIIFAIGRTLTPIMEQGIKPDFVVSVDPSDIIYDTFGKYKEYDIPLITLCNGNSKVVEGSKGEIYFLQNSSELIGLLGITVNPTLSVSGSVATLCLSSAHYMGCNPIMFIGQDFAYTNDEKHSQIAIMESEIADNQINVENNCYKYIKSYTGEKVISTNTLILFLRWFETFISEHREIQYINATEGGAYIEGAEHIPFEEAIKKYCVQTVKPVIKHKRILRDPEMNIDEVVGKTLKQLIKIKEYIIHVKESYEKLIDETEPEKIKQLIEVINSTDKKALELERGKEILQMLMEDIAKAIASSNDSKEAIGETKEERRKRILRLNLETYSYLEIESQKLIQLLEGEMEE